MERVRYLCSYLIRSGVDGFTAVVAEGRVEVQADTVEAAAAAARQWLWDNDPLCDDRIDPQVAVVAVTKAPPSG